MSDVDPPTAGGPGDRLLGWRQVKDITGLSRTTAWRMQNTGEFPQPVRISRGRVGWWQSELDAWKATRTSRWLPPAAPKLIPTPPKPRLKPETPLQRAPEPRNFSPPPEQAKRSRRRSSVAEGQIAFDF